MNRHRKKPGLAQSLQPARVCAEIPVLPPILQPSVVNGWDLHDKALKPRSVGDGTGRRMESYQLVFSDGQRVPCQGRSVVGRMPEQPGEHYTAYVVVEDPSHQTSRRHFEFGATPIGQVWVMDLGSANGTFVRSGETYMQLQAKKRTGLSENDVIRFGSLSAKVERSN